MGCEVTVFVGFACWGSMALLLGYDKIIWLLGVKVAVGSTSSRCLFS